MILIYITSAVLFALAAMHIYWAFGGEKFTRYVIPTSEEGEALFAPGRFVTFSVALFLLVGGLVLIQHLHHPSKANILVTIIYAGVFFLRGIGDLKYMGLFKKVTETDFGLLDTFLFTPLVFLVSFMFAYSLTI